MNINKYLLTSISIISILFLTVFFFSKNVQAREESLPAGEAGISADIEKVQTTFPVRMTDVRDVGIQTLSSFKINFLKRFFLNFKAKFTSDPAEKLDSTFKIWADRLYRLNVAKASGKIARINRALEKYLKANVSFEKALSLAEATLADSEINKILGIQDIMVKYAGFSDVIKYVLDGVQFVYEQAPSTSSGQVRTGMAALTAARTGFSQNLGEIESTNREAERIIADPIYKEYVKAMSSPRLTPSQKSLMTLNFFEAERERR
jgi:hypothetical protein